VGLACALIPLVVVAAMAACGGDSEPVPAALEDHPGHIHGIAINPRDGALFLATHRGLFRAARDDTTARRVGDHRRDLMGFTVVGADRFLASGHPDAREDTPPMLGLVMSSDAGETWRDVSLQGQVDLHVIRAASKQMYAFDSLTGNLLVSGNSGRTWSAGQPPAPLLDIAIDPADDRHIVASTERGAFGSRDGGVRWRALPHVAPALLTWEANEPRRLFSVDGDGAVRRSPDAGQRWSVLGRVGGAPTALTVADGTLFVALADGSVKRSGDGGRSWTLHLRTP
jgi:hypothetical protein